MSTSQSFQLPDLLNIIGSLELRTNPHCRSSTDASEKWICKELHALSESELTSLRAAKIGLLAGLCFPTCDAPQLRLLIDFMTLLFYSSIPGTNGRRSLWAPRAGKADADADESESGIDILGSHDLLKQLCRPFADQASVHGCTRVVEGALRSISVLLPHCSGAAAQEQLLFDPTPKSVSMPSVEAYVAARRELYGSSMTLGIAELLQVFQLPDFPPEARGGPAGAVVLAMGELKRAAFDVIAWSTVTALLRCRLLSTGQQRQLGGGAHGAPESLGAGAMNVCGQMIRGKFASFCELEQRILGLLVRPQGTIAALCEFSRAWMGSPQNAVSQDQEAAVRRYIKALQDCIVGTVHWIYETELFFGKKGSEIRNFGWIFVDQAPGDA
ncbi:hypothetical protein BJ912DRAFT_1056047 [Pholiota molesta]|nr:hypothetical protein BJ912DRAFT_1056047 [Pholiota molesta]